MTDQLPLLVSKRAKKLSMCKNSLARKLFDMEESDSDETDRSVIYISSSEDESSGDWETDCSTDTDQLMARIEREVTSSQMLFGGRIMTMDDPKENVSEVLYTGCMVCGCSADAIKKEKVDWYVSRSKPRGEPEYITKIRREAVENGLNAGAFLFITPAVSPAAACDGTTITTSANGQKIMPGTLPTF